MSVRARVALAVVVVAVPALVAAVVVSWTTRRDAMVDALAEATIDRMESGGRERCEADPERFTRGRRARPRILPYTAALEPGARGVPPMPAAIREGLSRGDDVAIERGDRSMRMGVRMPWSEGPCAVVVAERRERAARGPGMLRDLAVATGALALALIVAWVALGPPLRRLARLAESVRRSPPERIAVPSGIDGDDEIGEVARALDEAGARVRAHVATLEARERALTEYVDGTTHDLAIPLTVLSARLADAEAARRAGQVIDPALLAGAIAETEYVAQLVANMAAAARLEGAEPLDLRPVDLGAIVERVVGRHRVVAKHHASAIESAIPERAVIVQGDDILLERLISNLVHNAIRHRARGGEGHVAVVLSREGGRFVLRVIDDNAIDGATIARLGRGEDVGDRRRARGRGLGLRIVRTIAARHGLELAFARPEGASEGLEVRISGPVA